MTKLPQPIETYFSTTNVPDPKTFLSIFADDAVVVDDGQEYQGIAAIKEWSEQHHFANKISLEVTDTAKVYSKTVVTAKVDGDFDKNGFPEPLLLDFHFTIEKDKIKRLVILLRPKRIPKLPQPIETHFRAANAPSPSEFLSCFAPNAFVTDEGKDHHGTAAIKEWSDRAYFGDNLTLDVTDVTQSGDETIVTAKSDGNYDKTGLPDPLFLDFHFNIKDNKITRLYIVPTPDKLKPDS